MGESWQPREEGMREICSLLQEYRAPSADQTRVLHLLQRCAQLPDFNNYLAFILSRAEGQSVEVRQAAGLLLKNNLKAHYHAIAPIYQQHIKAEVLPCLGAPDKHIRSTVGTVISVIIEQGKVQCWPEILNALLQCLESNDYNHMEGALDALSKICEDIPESLDAEIPGISERPINVFIPRMLMFFSSPHVTLRRLSLSSVNQFIVFMPSALYANMDIYLQGLFSLAKDPAPEVRKLVCSALVQFVEVEYSFLQPHIQDVIEYMLQANQDKDAEVALESCGFWTAFCEARLPPELLRDFLPRLIALLLTNMVYLDDDEALIDADVDDSVPDRDQDLRPRFPQSRIHGGDEVNGEDEDDDDEDIINSWNLRKSSAASLDMLSNVFGDEMLPILMPLVQEKLLNASESAWKEREAAVLALGAVAEGCINGLLPYLSQIVTLLLPLLDDKRPLVRSISCWTMSRYSKWVCQASSRPEGRMQFDCVLTGLLGRILDSNKRVQNSACSAFAVLEEEAQDGLLFRLEFILQHLMHALGQYQRANLRVLYDAIGTLADAIRGDLNRPEYVGILMPPLMAKWQQLLDTDKDLFPLLECLTSISQALGPGFMAYAEPIFRRCVGIIRSQTVAKAGSGASGVIYDKEFVVCTLDLLSGLADGLGSSIENLIQGSDLRDLLLQCCSDEAADVRQSALGLLGDIAKICVIHLQPRVLDFLTVAANQLSLELKGNVSVANNACWAIGEVAIKIKKEVAPVAMTVLGHLVSILLNAEGFNRSLVENSAITLGRLGWVCPELISPHIEHFLRPWCRALSLIRDDVEKEDAFRGLCAMVRTNPSAGVESLMAMCEAICSWNEIPSLDLQKEIYEILHGYKQMLKGGGAWEQCMLAMDPSSKDKLVKKYGI